MRQLRSVLRVRLLPVIILMFLIAFNVATAGIPHTIIYQGQLSDSSGAPVADGPYQITFTIYDAPAAGTTLWSSGAQAVPLTGGLFTYQLGSAVPLPNSLFDADTVRYIGTQVGADPEMTPRVRMVSTPYSFHSGTADFAYSSQLFRLLPLADPGTCDTSGRGLVYYDSAMNELCYCNGTGWYQVDGGGPCGCTDADGDGVTDCAGDCDDNNPTIYPGATDIPCDGIDQDCDGVDAGSEDADADGVTVCQGDCDDNDATIHPGAFDIPCDGIDQNCDGVDYGTVDVDGDGYNACQGDCNEFDASINPGAVDVMCDGIDQDCNGTDAGQEDADGDGVSICQGDCDDNNAAVYPGATEICDGLDNDCDGVVDNGFDADGDGWTVCQGDCDDNNAAVYPGAPEICDGLDNNCDGTVDAPFDLDHDGWTTCAGDCDDTNGAIHPGAIEVCDGVDNNCDGQVDEGCP